jgi:uncharacterized protein (DUF885 family)
LPRCSYEAANEGDEAAKSLLPTVTPEADAARAAWLKSLQARLTAIQPEGLDDEGRLNRQMLLHLIDERLQVLAFDEARAPFSSDGGFHTTIGYIASRTKLDDGADAAAWTVRLGMLKTFYADNIANARRGVRDGFVQPRSTAEQVLARARQQADAPIAGDPLLVPFDTLPSSMPAAERADLRAAGEQMLRDVVRPAQLDFVRFLETEYLPAARKSLAARSLPNGEAYYRWLVKRHTTTDLSPDEVHLLGAKEVKRIRAEMDAVMAETGFKGDFPAFLVMLRSDPRFYAKSRQELLEKASEIAKRIDDQLPRWFLTLPRLTYGVRPVPADIEETYTTGRYFQGSPRLGIAGGYMVNTSKLDQRGLYELPSLTLHEAAPGHHLQIALSQELEGVPAFRRNAGVTAFTEGWGLYSEKLGGEMGIYRDPYERFGRLSYEMWRACRLVADTGIHWKGWSGDQAKECFLKNSALSPLNIDVEVARYISWPGQALAYKIGELKIIELRERARSLLGDRFDIRRFHDAVLLAGPLPLDLLEARIDAWIASEKG